MSSGLGSRPSPERDVIRVAREAGVPEDELRAVYHATVAAWSENHAAKREEEARIVAEADDAADSEPAPWQRADRQQTTYAAAVMH